MRRNNVPYTELRFRGTPEEVSAAWLKARKSGIGGSDVAAIMGFSKYSSPLEVWMTKTGRREDADLSGNQAVEWGNRLEPIVGAKFAENHPELKVMRRNAMLVSKARPWAFANLDYVALDQKTGDRYVLEIKTAGAFRRDDWEQGVPDYYMTQVAHYLSVTGYAGAWVAVLLGGQEYREFFVPRDADDIAAVEAFVDRFWTCNVQGDQMPAMVGSDSESSALHELNSAHDGEMDYQLDSDVPELMELEGVKFSISELTARRKKLEAELKARIGGSYGIETETRCVRWVRSTYESRTCDWKGFEKSNPGVLDDFITTETKTKDGGLRITAKKGA